jgi:hypothetical protein
MPNPVISKADPWIGSNMEGFSRVGSRLEVGAIPILPARAAARSERMSACCKLIRVYLTCVAENTHKIRRNNSIQTLGLKHHPRSHSINQHLINSNIRKLLRHIRRNTIPHHHTIPLRVTLRHNSKMLLWSLLRYLERKLHDSLDSMSSEDRHLSRCLPWLISMRDPTMSRIFAFTVLADDDPI